MSGGGGKGGKQTESTKLPAWLDQAAQRSVSRGEQAAQIGYQPWMGPSVAAQTPMQGAARGSVNSAAKAFGMPQAQGNGMPPPQTFANGMQGYSSFPLYDAALRALQQRSPGQTAAYNGMFVNPQTGAAPTAIKPK